jgi:hypothetical protein
VLGTRISVFQFIFKRKIDLYHVKKVDEISTINKPKPFPLFFKGKPAGAGRE